MGASESKLAFKEDIFRLAGEGNIDPHSDWWHRFINLPESADDVQTLWSPNDLRSLTGDNTTDRPPAHVQVSPKKNVETLIHHAVQQLDDIQGGVKLAQVPTLQRNAQILNATRVLTRLLPYIYEAEYLSDWEDRFFWQARKEKVPGGNTRQERPRYDAVEGPQEAQEDEKSSITLPPLGEHLIDLLLNYLFFPGLTLPSRPDGVLRSSRTVWQSGIGSARGAGLTKENERAAVEILRLLLVLASRAMYIGPNVVAERDVKPLTYMTTNVEREMVLPLLCSLLNTVLKYNQNTWGLPLDLNGPVKDSKQVLVTYCLQFTLVLVTYPTPEDGVNEFRRALGRLHRAEHFQFLVEGLKQILMQPTQGTFASLPRLTSIALPVAPDTLSLFWELLQCNKRFRSYLIDTGRSVDFVILVLFYIIDGRDDPAKQNIVRMCVFTLQSLSIEEKFGRKLNLTLNHSESLPQQLQVPKFHGSYADFLIAHIHALLTQSNAALETLFPALLAIINNISPELRGLERATSSKLIDIFARFSTPSVLLANETNHTLVSSIIDAINAILEHQYEENRAFVEVLVSSRKRFEAFRALTVHGFEKSAATFDGMSTSIDDDLGSLASDSEDETEASEASKSGGGMSERARGKRPVGGTEASESSNSRTAEQAHGLARTAERAVVATPEWFSEWAPYVKLHTILKTIEDARNGKLPPCRDGVQPYNPPGSPSKGSMDDAERAKPPPSEATSLKIQSFKWTSLSLGWYLSMLWGFIYAADAAHNRGNSGIWTGTHIRLFNIVSQRQDITLRSPKGAVDAAGDAIAQRLSNFSFGRGGATSKEV